MQYVKYVLFKSRGNIGELAYETVVVQDQDIVVQITESKEDRARI
jgi:hypothetical protein